MAYAHPDKLHLYENGLQGYTRISNHWNKFVIWSDDVLDFIDTGSALGDFLLGMIAFVPMGWWNNRLFIFHVNPQQMSVSRSKSNQVTLTSGGAEVAIGKEQMLNYRLTATTGCLMPQHKLWKHGLKDQLFSIAWHRFETFQRFWEESTDKAEIMNLIFDREYSRGHLTDFSFTRDAEDPWEIIMEMTFLVYPKSRYNLLTYIPTPVLEVFNIASVITDSETQFF